MTNSTHFNMKSIAWWRGKNLINLFEEDWKQGKVLERKKVLDWRVNFHWKSFWWKSPTDRRQECNFSCFWQLTKVVTKNFPSTLNMISASCIFVLENQRKSKKQQSSFRRKRRLKITDEKSWKLIGSRNPKTYGLGRLCKRQDSSGSIITFRGLAPPRVWTCSGEELESWTTGRNFN